MDPRATPAGSRAGRRAASRRPQPAGADGLAGARSWSPAHAPQPRRCAWPHPHTDLDGGATERRRHLRHADRMKPSAGGSAQTRTLLLYAQDNQGLGHVTRTLTLARHVLARHPDCIAYIATKSPLAGFTLPERCDYIKLPTLLTAGAVRPTAAEEEAAKQHFRTIRGAILRDAVLGLVPDLVLVDHEVGDQPEHRIPQDCTAD